MLILNSVIIAIFAACMLLRPSLAGLEVSLVGRILDVAGLLVVFSFVVVLPISAVIGLLRAARGSWVRRAHACFLGAWAMSLIAALFLTL